MCSWTQCRGLKRQSSWSSALQPRSASRCATERGAVGDQYMRVCRDRGVPDLFWRPSSLARERAMGDGGAERSLCVSWHAGSRSTSWFPATTTLVTCGRDESQFSCRRSSGNVPPFVRSPAWMSMSPAGSVGQAVWVSEMQTMLIGFLDGAGVAMGHWWV